MGIRIQRFVKDEWISTKGSKLAAGHDLHSIEDYLIPADNWALVKIGLAMAVPEGTYSHIVVPRSCLATRGILIDVGVIDADYWGEVKVVLINYGKLDYKVKIGGCIAQLIVEELIIRNWKRLISWVRRREQKKVLAVVEQGWSWKKHNQQYTSFNQIVLGGIRFLRTSTIGKTNVLYCRRRRV